MVDRFSYQIMDEYQTFIRPERNPHLTKFCRELTSITQKQVDSAPGFIEAISDFKGWLYKYHGFAFCSWGDYDKYQFENDCQYHSQPMPIGAPHFNIKKLFSKAQRIKKKLGMAQALNYIGAPLEGTHHRGIDDARNMAKLMPYIAR